MRITILSVILAIGFSAAAQQGNNFSLWYLNNMQHNPAAAGTNNNDLKAFANFRYQYFTVTEKPYRSISASVESKILKSKRGNGYFGIGGVFNNDATGDMRYTVNNFSVPISYHIFFNKESSLSLGVSPGWYQRSVERSGYTWENQWTGYGFSPGIPGEDLRGATSVDKFNLGAGLFFQNKTSAYNKVYFGVSADHLLSQDIGFFIEDNLARRYTLQFGMTHRFDLTRFGISPNVFAMTQGPNMNVMFGLNFNLYLQDPSLRTIFVNPNYLSLGVYYRLNEGVVLNVLVEYEDATFAFGYDTNINSMLPYSKSIGGIEVAVTYDLIFNKKEKYIY